MLPPSPRYARRAGRRRPRRHARGVRRAALDRLRARRPAVRAVELVDGLENPAECFGNIIDWLVAQDWSDDEIRAVVGGNTVRALERIWV
jgi:hypothetical protein